MTTNCRDIGSWGCNDVTMYASYQQSWADPDSPWWAKVRRAQEHMETLRRQVESYREAEPCVVLPEPTDQPGRIAHRLKITKPIPVEICTTLGDALHNLRTALESIAFEAARRSRGGTLTVAEEKKPTFPICVTPAEFNSFVAKMNGLYNDATLQAFRIVQPFLMVEEMQKLDSSPTVSFEEHARIDPLYGLHTLWNIDKHRRLALMAWWPDLIYWGSTGPTERRFIPGDGTCKDGSILYYTEGGNPQVDGEMIHQFSLALTDAPAFRYDPGGSDVIEVLDNWYQHIVQLSVFPQLFRMIP